MRQGFSHVTNNLDSDGNPTGGVVVGNGFTISWQDGPLGRGEVRRAPNGAFVEDVIESARQRIEFYQTASGGRFACEQNDAAMWHLEQALIVLDDRTQDRESRGVEGTHQA